MQSDAITVEAYEAEHADGRSADALAGLACGKSCIRYTPPARIDRAVVDQLIAATAG